MTLPFHLVFRKKDVHCGVVLETHFEVKILENPFLARLGQLRNFHLLVVGRVEESPQKLTEIG